MSCLLLVLMLALALLGHLTMVAGYDGSAEKNCNLSRISLKKDFDPKSIDGFLYPIYKSHFPPYYDNVDLIRYTLKHRKFNDDRNGEKSFIVVERSYIYKDGTCSNLDLMYDVTIPGKATTSYVAYPDSKSVVQYDAHIMEADDNALLYYELVTINGKISKEYSSLGIKLKDPKKPFLLSNAMKRKLCAFCGPDAADISFFKKYPFNYDAKCA